MKYLKVKEKQIKLYTLTQMKITGFFCYPTLNGTIIKIIYIVLMQKNIKIVILLEITQIILNERILAVLEPRLLESYCFV